MRSDEGLAAALGGPHVLVIEDIDTTRRRIVDILREHGYRVSEAVDGLEALRKLSGARVDVILLDLLLPKVDGWRFRETQLRHPELANIPTVVVTVRALRAPDRYVLRTDDVVLKPIEDQVLLAAVRSACDRAERPMAESPVHPDELFWSRQGEVACWEHAPRHDSERWYAEQWAPIPDGAHKHRIVYQCQHCPGHDGPLGHQTRKCSPLTN